LDIGLPVMDGHELAAGLRELPDLNGMKLIALTGYGQESDRQRSREAGFDHHFSNPSASSCSNQWWPN
jgi:CheY-like chemotaxis protein